MKESISSNPTPCLLEGHIMGNQRALGYSRGTRRVLGHSMHSSNRALEALWHLRGA